MTTAGHSANADNPTLGIILIVTGMFAISVNDMLIKLLAGAYPLHQIVFARSAIGLLICLVIVALDGGLAILKTPRPLLHMLRGLLIVIANTAFFLGFVIMPLADVTALFFVAPLLITLLSMPLLGERVGARRIGAVVVGFIGVVIMIQPGSGLLSGSNASPMMLLPLVAALAYALMQILTRKLGIDTKASALAVYIQLTFVAVSVAFGLVAGDGRFAAGVSDESLRFLLRAWQWPQANDMWLMLLLGTVSAVISYTLSAAYRSASAATIAPFEYVELPMAIFWGWLFWREFPTPSTGLGIALIAGAGIYVFWRERARKRPVAIKRPTRRW